MITYKDNIVTASGEVEEIIIEVACIVSSIGESIKGMQNCTEEEKREFMGKFQSAMYYATMNPEGKLKPKGVVIEI